MTKLTSDIFLLQETKLNPEKALEFKKICYFWDGIFQEAHGLARGLGILWNPSHIEISCFASSDFWMAYSIKCKKSNICFLLFNIYGRVKTEDKRKVWSKVSELALSLDLGKVVMVGDFNTILCAEDKWGGLKLPTKVVEDFKDFVTICKVADIIPKNGTFTWNNRRRDFVNIAERLDRFFIGEWWMLNHHSIDSIIEPQCGSDHYLISLNIGQDLERHKSYFKFLSMWWLDPTLLSHIKNWWCESNVFSGSPSFKFTKRLQFIKRRLKEWNNSSFKNVFAEKARIEGELEVVNSVIMAHGMTNVEFEAEKSLKAQYSDILRREE
ncbi:uncharacterized protein LOC131857524 [Cryptomeria japonica]|uniref:uncharacterized protein LOC131857524 n=1 Tax=Cryptomeria japonica TaxID=3369 RepID=UPI0027DAABD6|nr:uncharacterized protein LOC131857524 [Cryptomeria japonica]